MKRQLLFVALCATLPVVALAARMPRSPSKRPPQVRPHRPERPARIAKPNVADTVDRLSKMPLPERERVLANLPGKQQKEIASGLDRIEQFDPAYRAQLLNRYRNFENLTPKQKDQVRDAVRQFTKLPEPRRAALKGELDQLDKLSPTDRARHLISDDYRNRFGPQERHIIENTSSSLLK